MRLWIALCILPLGIGLATEEVPPQTAAILKLIKDKKIRSVDALIENLPARLQRHWLPIPSSQSAQEGRKFLLRLDGSRFTMTFNLAPNREGFDSVEIKEFITPDDEADYEFTEVRFEDDFQPVGRGGRVRKQPTYQDGVHVTRKATDVPFLDNLSTCSSCHAGGDSRFDRREVYQHLNLAKLKKDKPKDWEELMALLKDRKSPRAGHLFRSPAVQKAVAADDAAALEKIWKEEADKMHEEVARLNAQVIASKVVRLIAQKDPAAAPGLLAILKGCDHQKLYTPAQWNRRVQFLQSPHGPFEATDSLALKGSRWTEEGTVPGSPIALYVTRIEGVRAGSAKRYQSGDMTDDTPLPQLAQIAFHLDEMVHRGHDAEHRVPLGQDLEVAHWSPASDFHGFWFSGTFHYYQAELLRRLQPYLEKQFGLGAKDQTCPKLEALSRNEFTKADKEVPPPRGEAPGPAPKDPNTGPPEHKP